MCWHIVETKNGSVALDGEVSAHAYYHAQKLSGFYAKSPRPANSNDIVDATAVKEAEERISMRRAEREYMNRIGLFNCI